MMLRLEGLKVGIENLIKSLKGDVIVSDVYDYDYEVKNQKEIRQIYPNSEGVEVYLGLSDTVEDGISNMKTTTCSKNTFHMTDMLTN